MEDGDELVQGLYSVFLPDWLDYFNQEEMLVRPLSFSLFASALCEGSASRIFHASPWHARGHLKHEPFSARHDSLIKKVPCLERAQARLSSV